MSGCFQADSHTLAGCDERHRQGLRDQQVHRQGTFETSGGRVREEETPRMVGVPESILRCANSLSTGRPAAVPHRPNLLLREHDGAGDAAANPIKRIPPNPSQRFPWTRMWIDPAPSG